jgi:Zn-dependent peptidase ImmA (M78 family)
MHVGKKDLNHCLRKATEIAEQYRLQNIGSDDPQRNLESFVETVRRFLGVDVRLFQLQLDKEDSVVFSACVMYEDKHCDVLFVDGLNTCWRRYVVCKELFHIIIDLPEYRNMNIEQHVQELTVAFPDDDSSPEKAAVAEFIAEIAAMEFLFPYAKRAQELAQAGGTADYAAIARKYRVPVLFVERYLSQEWMRALGDTSLYA